jgi:hypothetical protein
MHDDYVRFPCSSRRECQHLYGKLLTRVDPQAVNGFGFEGSLVRPGKNVPWSALWPTPAHPKIPIYLEYAGSHKAGWGKRKEPDQYILWRFDPGTSTWQELARSSSLNWTWAVDLRPIAIRALEESFGSALVVYGDFEQVVTRLDHLLTFELGKLPESERGRAVGFLHDQFCSRIVRLELQ